MEVTGSGVLYVFGFFGSVLHIVVQLLSHV